MHLTQIPTYFAHKNIYNIVKALHDFIIRKENFVREF